VLIFDQALQIFSARARWPMLYDAYNMAYWTRPEFEVGPKASSSQLESNGLSPCFVKLLFDTLVASKKKERHSAECSLETFQELLLCLACPSNGEIIVGFDSKELRSLKASTERVAVLWLSAVPWPWQPAGSEKDSFSLDSFPTYSPAVELDIKCPDLARGEDAFLSTTSLKIGKSSSKPEAPTASQLVLSFKELVANTYPVPSAGEVFEDREWTAKHGKRVYSFKWDKRTLISFYNNFETCSKPSDNAPLFAVDCEMVRTASDMMTLARVSIVDQRGRCVYDTYVKPSERVTDYRTKYSGITAKTLKRVTTSLEDVQEKLLNLLPKDAILVGQSLDSDFLALKFAHPHIIDTATIFIPSCGARKPPLSSLASGVLGKELKRGESGHDSITDALTCLELVQAKISASSSCKIAPGIYSDKANITFFDVLHDLEISSVIIGSARLIKKYLTPSTFIHTAARDEYALKCVGSLSSVQFGWLQLQDYEANPAVFEFFRSVKMPIGRSVKSIVSSVAAGTFCVLVFGGSCKVAGSQLLRSLVFIKS
jgi:DNA polymerase III epsilon subunit-like protein